MIEIPRLLAERPLIDSELHQRVLHELSLVATLNAAVICVSVRESVVTLSGQVASYVEKFSAETAANRVHGVRAIANELAVGFAQSAGAAVASPFPAEKRTDEQIAADAARALAWRLFVPAHEIKVIVENGWITLEGQVTWQFQRHAAEKAATFVRGAQGVKNLITIKPRISASALTTSIADAFRQSAETDAKGIRADIKGGTVILRGTVASLAERDEAERQARETPGVISVENMITVAAS